MRSGPSRSDPEVLIGAGLATLEENPALRTALDEPGDYVVAERSEGADGNETLTAATAQAVARPQKLFGLFGAGDYWTTPVPQDSPGDPRFTRDTADPTLAAATRANPA